MLAGVWRTPGRLCNPRALCSVAAVVHSGQRAVPEPLHALDVKVDLCGVVAAHHAGEAGDREVRVVGQTGEEVVHFARGITAHRRLELRSRFQAALSGAMHSSHTLPASCCQGRSAAAPSGAAGAGHG